MLDDVLNQIKDYELIDTLDDDGFEFSLSNKKQVEEVEESIVTPNKQMDDYYFDSSIIDVEEVKPIQPIKPIKPPTFAKKSDIATHIYLREKAKGDLVRKFIVQMFINEAGLTPAGAATYYANLKSKLG